MSERNSAMAVSAGQPVPEEGRAEPWPDHEPQLRIQVGTRADVSLSASTAVPFEISVEEDSAPVEPATATDGAPTIMPLERSASVPETHPGSVGFPVGSGVGQWGLLGLVVAASATCLTSGVYVAAMVLAAGLAACGIARAILPGRWVPALVNRGRAFDVTAWLLSALVLASLALTAPQL